MLKFNDVKPFGHNTGSWRIDRWMEWMERRTDGHRSTANTTLIVRVIMGS